MPDVASQTERSRQRRPPTLVAAALLLGALAVVVMYTSRGAFFSPLAMVVVAAIGSAALLLQMRLRPGKSGTARSPLWLNGLGVVLALAAVLADFLRLKSVVMPVCALGAVVAFGVSGIIVLSAMRKSRA